MKNKNKNKKYNKNLVKNLKIYKYNLEIFLCIVYLICVI